MRYYSYYMAPVGQLLLECDGGALTGLWIRDQKFYAIGADADMHFDDGQPALILARRWLDDYFAGRRVDARTISVAPRGTDFQRTVWCALRTIPYGETRTYADIARMVGSSPRAVGGAIGRNPISIIIPCHRVIGTGGGLTGYAGGIDIKQKLLAGENK